MKYEKVYILSINSIQHNIHMLERKKEDSCLCYLESDLHSLIRSKARMKTPVRIGSILSKAESKGFLVNISGSFLNSEFEGNAHEYIYVGNENYFFNQLPSYFKKMEVKEFLKLQNKENWLEEKYLKPVLNEIKKEIKDELLFRLIGIFSVLLIIAFSHPIINKIVVSVFPPIATFFAVGLLGVGLYMFRCRWRTYYGSLEIFFGMFIATNFIFPLQSELWSYIQMIGGTYIVVRGLDNLGKGTVGKNKIWRKLFPEQDKDSSKD